MWPLDNLCDNSNPETWTWESNLLFIMTTEKHIHHYTICVTIQIVKPGFEQVLHSSSWPLKNTSTITRYVLQLKKSWNLDLREFSLFIITTKKIHSPLDDPCDHSNHETWIGTSTSLFIMTTKKYIHHYTICVTIQIMKLGFEWVLYFSSWPLKNKFTIRRSMWPFKSWTLDLNKYFTLHHHQ